MPPTAEAARSFAPPSRIASAPLDTREINLAVPGLRHHEHLAQHLHDRGLLSRFYYSHHLKTTPESLGLPSEDAINLFAKEYLVRGHLMLVGWRGFDAMLPFYSRLWEQGVFANWVAAPLWHVLLWGSSPNVLRRARREGAVTLGMAVNAHPKIVERLLSEEAERLGLPYRERSPRARRAILDEITQCDAIHVLSTASRQSFIEAGFAGSKIVVAPMLPDARLFFPDPLPGPVEGGPLSVISVGQLTLRKGQIHLLRALRHLDQTLVKVKFIGAIDHLYGPHVAEGLSAAEHIANVPNPQLRSHLLQADVFVAPSIEDGLNVAALEALFCGLPVIATTQTGCVDFIEDGVDGFVVPPSSPEAIAARLDELARDRGRLAWMKQNAVVKRQQMLANPGYHQQLEGAYDRLLAEADRTGPAALPPAQYSTQAT